MNQSGPPHPTPPPQPEPIEDAREALARLLGELLVRYQSGDRSGADQFVAVLHPILYRYFLAQAGSSGEAEDLLQECWIRIHRGRASYRPGEPVLPWAFAIARHTRIDEYRKNSARANRETAVAATAGTSTDPRTAIEQGLAASEILSRLHDLPQGQRGVFVLLKVHGMSVDEVANLLGSSRMAVKQKAFRAYEALRKWFADQRPAPNPDPGVSL